MKVLVFQHAACEGPGIFGDILKEQDIPFETVPLYDGGKIPDVSRYDALIVLGGPMNVYEEEKYPFLWAEDKMIKRAIRQGIPYFGVCLGAQLLAKALNVAVHRNPVKEIGFSEVELTHTAGSDPVFRGLPRKFAVFQWHGDTFSIPHGATKLAYSSVCPNQAFRYGDNAYALQFHLETSCEMIESWTKEYQDELAAEGPSVKDRVMPADFATQVEQVQQLGRQLFNNFVNDILLGNGAEAIT